jgi:DNA replication protein DnaC
MRSPEITAWTSQPSCRTPPNCYSRSVRIKMDSALNLGYDEWQNFLGDKSMVDALLSRVRHYCHTVTINGPSLREPQG